MKMRMLLLCLGLLVIINSCSDDENSESPPTTVAVDIPDPDFVINDPNDVGKDWEGIAVTANAGDNKKWELQTDVSDDFNYSFPASTTNGAGFGGGKWINFYHNSWPGPDPTRWMPENVSVNGGNLEIVSNRVNGEIKGDCDGTDLKETRTGCVSSKKRVLYPVYIESRIRIANSVMASNVWMLSADDTQELDIVEAYGGRAGEFPSDIIHLSHHTFKRTQNKIYDYQPNDSGAWYSLPDLPKLGGEWVRGGLYWRDPKHLEYYINGEHVRTLSDNYFATKINGQWKYSYPRAPISDTELPKEPNGFQQVINAPSAEIASNSSSTSVIDPLNHLNNGMNIDKELDIIINMEDQTWRACGGSTPTDEELQNIDDHTLKVDWIRIYKPVDK